LAVFLIAPHFSSSKGGPPRFFLYFRLFGEGGKGTISSPKLKCSSRVSSPPKCDTFPSPPLGDEVSTPSLFTMMREKKREGAFYFFPLPLYYHPKAPPFLGAAGKTNESADLLPFSPVSAFIPPPFPPLFKGVRKISLFFPRGSFPLFPSPPPLLPFSSLLTKTRRNCSTFPPLPLY